MWPESHSLLDLWLRLRDPLHLDYTTFLLILERDFDRKCLKRQLRNDLAILAWVIGVLPSYGCGIRRISTVALKCTMI
jgi:hypothetical protein